MAQLCCLVTAAYAGLDSIAARISLPPTHHRSIEFRLRLPGVDLWTTHKPLAAEVCLMFMLLGAGGHCCTSGARKVGGAGCVLCSSRWPPQCASCPCCWGEASPLMCAAGLGWHAAPKLLAAYNFTPPLRCLGWNLWQAMHVQGRTVAMQSAMQCSA